jgi:hypothetical protein
MPIPLRIAAAHRHHGHERVVHDDVGLLQQALGAKRREIGLARSGAASPQAWSTPSFAQEARGQAACVT